MFLKRILSSVSPVLLLCLAVTAPVKASTTSTKAVEGVVNINTATVAELTMLPGIGKVKAEQIVQQRKNKPFTSVDELKSIPGLGAKRIDAMRAHVVTQGVTTAKRLPAKKSPKPAGAPVTASQS